MAIVQVQVEVKLDACHEPAENTDDRVDPSDHYGFYSLSSFGFELVHLVFACEFWYFKLIPAKPA